MPLLFSDGASVSHFTMGCGPVCVDGDTSTSKSVACVGGCEANDSLGGEGVGMRMCYCIDNLCNGATAKSSVAFLVILTVVKALLLTLWF